MKDESIANLEMNFPSAEGDATIETCLQALYDDATHSMTDEFAPHVTYGELVDALLAARYALYNLRELQAEVVNDEWLDDYDDDWDMEDWSDIDDFDDDLDDDFDDELEAVLDDLGQNYDDFMEAGEFE